VKTVAIRNYQPAPQIGEGGAFGANLYLDGKKAAHVENDGRGGCNRYHFDTRANRDAFFAYAEAWATAQDKKTSEPADALIGELCDEYEFTAKARALARQGATTVVLIEKEPRWFAEDHTGDPDYYDKTYLVGLRGDQDPKTVAEAESAAKWRVISTD